MFICKRCFCSRKDLNVNKTDNISNRINQSGSRLSLPSHLESFKVQELCEQRPPRVHTSVQERINHSVQTRPDTFKNSSMSSLLAGPECSRNFTAPRGVIKTPGFPEKYPNNLDCTFMIFAPQMSEIVVEFDSFDMEPDTTPPPGALCRYDWLEIWDGFPAGEEKHLGL